MAVKKRSIKQLMRIMKRKGYVIYDKPFRLNIVGIRNKDVRPTHFDDALYVFWKNNVGDLVLKSFSITTDPSVSYLKNPAKDEGTAILKAGQYVNAYKIGLHRGKYIALVQTGAEVTVYRNWNRKAYLFFDDGKTDTGYFGINIHRAKAKGTTKEIDVYSAGCQVFANASDFDEFMRLCDQQKQHGESYFTYTLIDEWMIGQQRRRIILAVSIIAVMIVVLSFVYFKYVK